MVASVRVVSATGALLLLLGGFVGACGDDSRGALPEGVAGRAAGGHPEAGGTGGAGMAGGGMSGRGSPSPLPPPGKQLPPGSWCEPDGWCWYNPLPNGNQLTAVAGAGRTDLWIGGEADFGNEGSGHLLHFDAGRWIIEPSSLALNKAIWASADDDVWVVGAQGLSLPGAIYHIRGGGPPELTVFDDVGLLTDVWGASASDIYAVGVDFTTNVESALHWDGSAWTSIPGVAGRRVAGTGPDDVWIASFGGLLHFDGAAWSRVPALDGVPVVALSLAARGDVWLVTDRGGGLMQAEHLDATGLHVSLQTTSFNEQLTSISATSNHDVWVVGSSFDVSGRHGYLSHYDGQSWVRGVDAPTSLERVAHVAGFGDIAVGGEGGMVQLAAGPPPGFTDLRLGTSADLAGVFGSAPTDMWAVGEGGTTLHYDGRTVAAVPAGTSANLKDVWGTSANDVWAVGDGGTVIHYDGSRFAPVASGTTVDLKAVFTARPDDVWIGGDGPTLLHWDGSAMTPVTLVGANPGSAVLDLHGIAADDVWLSGGSFAYTMEQGYVAHFDGAAWSPVSVLTFASYGGLSVTQPLARVWQLAPDDVWVSAGQLELRGGGPDAYMHFDGTTWTQLLLDLTGLPQPEPPIVFPNRDRPSFVFGPHDRWRVDFFGIWQRNTN